MIRKPIQRTPTNFLSISPTGHLIGKKGHLDLVERPSDAAPPKKDSKVLLTGGAMSPLGEALSPPIAGDSEPLESRLAIALSPSVEAVKFGD